MPPKHTGITGPHNLYSPEANVLDTAEATKNIVITQASVSLVKPLLCMRNKLINPKVLLNPSTTPWMIMIRNTTSQLSSRCTPSIPTTCRRNSLNSCCYWHRPIFLLLLLTTIRCFCFSRQWLHFAQYIPNLAPSPWIVTGGVVDRTIQKSHDYMSCMVPLANALKNNETDIQFRYTRIATICVVHHCLVHKHSNILDGMSTEHMQHLLCTL